MAEYENTMANKVLLASEEIDKILVKYGVKINDSAIGIAVIGSEMRDGRLQTLNYPLVNSPS